MDSNTLLAYQPDCYKTSDVMKQINTANASELTILNNKVDKEYNNMYIDTADADTLSRIEKDNGLTIMPTTYDLDYRRSRIYSKILGKNDFSVDIIKNIASLYKSIDTIVNLDLPNFKLTINLNFNTGIPKNLNDFEDIIEDNKPAYFEANYRMTSQTKDTFSIRAFMICGEEIRVYPYQTTNIESKGQMNIAIGQTAGAEIVEIKPKGEI